MRPRTAGAWSATLDKTLLLAKNGCTVHQKAKLVHPRQVIGFVVLVLGVYVLTATKDSRPGCASGARSVLGQAHSSEYKALAVVEPIEAS